MSSDSKKRKTYDTSSDISDSKKRKTYDTSSDISDSHIKDTKQVFSKICKSYMICNSTRLIIDISFCKQKDNDKTLVQYGRVHFIFEGTRSEWIELYEYVNMSNTTKINHEYVEYVKVSYSSMKNNISYADRIKLLENNHPEYSNNDIEYIGIANDLHHIKCNTCNSFLTASWSETYCNDIMTYIIKNHDSKKFSKNHDCNTYFAEIITEWRTLNNYKIYKMEKCITNYLSYLGKSEHKKYKLMYNKKIMEFTCEGDKDFENFMNFIICNRTETDLIYSGLCGLYLQYSIANGKMEIRYE